MKWRSPSAPCAAWLLLLVCSCTSDAAIAPAQYLPDCIVGSLEQDVAVHLLQVEVVTQPLAAADAAKPARMAATGSNRSEVFTGRSNLSSRAALPSSRLRENSSQLLRQKSAAAPVSAQHREPLALLSVKWSAHRASAALAITLVFTICFVLSSLFMYFTRDRMAESNSPFLRSVGGGLQNCAMTRFGTRARPPRNGDLMGWRRSGSQESRRGSACPDLKQAAPGGVPQSMPGLTAKIWAAAGVMGNTHSLTVPVLSDAGTNDASSDARSRRWTGWSKHTMPSGKGGGLGVRFVPEEEEEDETPYIHR